ncbi:hypothetical protein B0H34DRAFT_649301 [Crassisporium funariophilum]|nr:hypothetical protein B0H34DRAFT_649301 [Crassisporium funariophilum]
MKLNTNYRHPPDQPGSASSAASSLHQESSAKSYMSDPRPSSPYVFGDATAHSSDHSSQLRKLLHSPSSEHGSHRPNSSVSHDAQEPSRTYSGSNLSKDPNHMNVDNDRPGFSNRRNIREPTFDFNMRRHSIAVGQNPITLPHLSSTLHGTKRKMSGDRGIFAPVGEDIDPQLVGPGVPSVMDIDADAPAPKRRGSTIDTQRIAQMSLNDRRNSVDSRGTQWLLNDRRESAPSLFHNVPGISTFNTNFNASESQHGRPSSNIAAFSWPNNSSTGDSGHSSSITNDPNHNSRGFDPAHQMNLVPPMNYSPDRRMSVPDSLTNPVPSRVLRSRSRPPSRQNTDPHSGPSSGQEEPSSASSPNASGKLSKEAGLTPYSRSPELRVSHKLAERKRRKEMKDLFDELRDQLPADRGMKASKWEILSKAIDFVSQLKRSHQELAQEVEILRQQVNGSSRPEGINGFPPGAPPPPHSNYGSIPPIFPPPIMHPHQPSTNHPGHPESRSNSSQNLYPPPHNSSSQNGNSHRIDGPP